ncbi:hypothetical protein PspLS_08455 [Pyricularia sp. CBS 133598]|nr:hypothetical protein PspLS_08455 [Pyricularia sp. CBS 133598]
MPPTTLEESIRPFQTQPWCVRLIQDPAYTVHTPKTRSGLPDAQDELFANTMNQPHCLPGFLCLDKKPTKPDGVVEERITLFAIGQGLEGWTGITHGGMVAALIDEANSMALQCNIREGGPWGAQKVVTKYLNITYVRPVPAPAIVQCKAQFERLEGRKIFYKTYLQDGNNYNLAVGDFVYCIERKAIKRRVP